MPEEKSTDTSVFFTLSYGKPKTYDIISVGEFRQKGGQPYAYATEEESRSNQQASGLSCIQSASQPEIEQVSQDSCGFGSRAATQPQKVSSLMTTRVPLDEGGIRVVERMLSDL